jgi:hypothetical protein
MVLIGRVVAKQARALGVFEVEPRAHQPDVEFLCW